MRAPPASDGQACPTIEQLRPDSRYFPAMVVRVDRAAYVAA